MGDENKTTQELVDELKALVEKYDAPAEDGTAQEPTEQDAERMSQLTAEIEKRNAAAEKNRETRAAAVAAPAPPLRAVPHGRSIPCRWEAPRPRAAASPTCATLPTTAPPRRAAS